MNDSKLDSIMRKVAALLERADHPNTPPAEAESCRAKADAMMFKYKIEAVRAPEKTTGFVPAFKEFKVPADSNSEFKNYYLHIAGAVVQHVGSRSVRASRWNGTAYEYTLDVCAFPSDLRYAEVLFMGCMLEFGRRLEPRYDPNLSDQENVYNMRSAGMERGRIGAAIWGVKHLPNDFKAQNRKVTKLFKAECAKRGDNAEILLGRGNNMAAFRLAYAEGFTQTIVQRLARMRAARGSESAAVELVSIRERINEAFYEKYPELRPTPPDPSQGPIKAPEPCARCQRAKSGYCREHAYLRPRKSDVKYLRADGFNRGATAAEMVDLGREGTARTNSAERKELR